MEPSIERAIAERSSSQLGLITIGQAVGLGLSRRTINRRLEAGSYQLLGRQVLCAAPLLRDGHQAVLAACLDVDGTSSHRTAARLHGLHAVAAPPLPDVAVPKSRRSARTPLARVHSSTNL